MRKSLVISAAVALLLCGSLVAQASTTLADSSMSLVDSSGWSVYTSSMGGGDMLVRTDYQVKDIAYQGHGRYQLALACEAHCADLKLPVAAAEIGQVKVGDRVHSIPEPYGVSFDVERTGAVIALLVQPGWAREIPPARVAG